MEADGRRKIISPPSYSTLKQRTCPYASVFGNESRARLHASDNKHNHPFPCRPCPRLQPTHSTPAPQAHSSVRAPRANILALTNPLFSRASARSASRTRVGCPRGPSARAIAQLIPPTAQWRVSPCGIPCGTPPPAGVEADWARDPRVQLPPARVRALPLRGRAWPC
jgi:hypothetical protein